MNKVLLKQKAISLELSLDQYSGNKEDILAVKSSTINIVDLAKNGLVDLPIYIDDVPGGYQWKNSGMSWPEDIRNSYHEFRVEISGGLSDAAKAFLASREAKNI
ncbi:hypothetical protein A9Q89_01105 [Gammaproteobacteria bacterium 53_120_T64]|nr:hypothetical protein A9Q89_01105 [Gammaproteobacteria bacterium 53_120_T64]